MLCFYNSFLYVQNISGTRRKVLHVQNIIVRLKNFFVRSFFKIAHTNRSRHVQKSCTCNRNCVRTTIFHTRQHCAEHATQSCARVTKNESFHTYKNCLYVDVLGKFSEFMVRAKKKISRCICQNKLPVPYCCCTYQHIFVCTKTCWYVQTLFGMRKSWFCTYKKFARATFLLRTAIFLRTKELFYVQCFLYVLENFVRTKNLAPAKQIVRAKLMHVQNCFMRT